MIRFWVRDNGAGFTQEAQESLFTEFTRLDITQVEGQGLGLSIVKRIIDKLGGEVGVKSEPGQGSTFFFTLPAAGGEAFAERVPAPAAPIAQELQPVPQSDGTFELSTTPLLRSLLDSFLAADPALVTELHQAAGEGDLARMISSIEQIVEGDPFLGGALERLARDLEDDTP
jgi:hypothetical protein